MSTMKFITPRLNTNTSRVRPRIANQVYRANDKKQIKCYVSCVTCLRVRVIYHQILCLHHRRKKLNEKIQYKKNHTLCKKALYGVMSYISATGVNVAYLWWFMCTDDLVHHMSVGFLWKTRRLHFLDYSNGVLLTSIRRLFSGRILIELCVVPFLFDDGRMKPHSNHTLCYSIVLVWKKQGTHIQIKKNTTNRKRRLLLVSRRQLTQWLADVQILTCSHIMTENCPGACPHIKHAYTRVRWLL